MSNVMGKAARMILGAIVDGETDPVKLADMALGRVRADEQQLVAALTGHVDDHHRFLLREHLTQIELLDRAIDRVTSTREPKSLGGIIGPTEPGRREKCEAQNQP